MKDRLFLVFCGIVDFDIVEQGFHIACHFAPAHRYLRIDAKLSRLNVKLAVSAQQVVQRWKTGIANRNIKIKVGPRLLGAKIAADGSYATVHKTAMQAKMRRTLAEMIREVGHFKP